MRAIAEFAMRSRLHAIGASMVAGVLPLLGWLSLVIVALVCLRQGAMAGSLVLLWTLLPFGVQTYMVGDPTIISLVGVFVLAALLRTTLSWEIVLLAAVVYAAIGGLLFEFIGLEKFLVVYTTYMEQLNLTIGLTESEWKTVVPASITLMVAYAMVLMLILARWCQSALYNPGEFRKEFHQIRLSPIPGGVLLAGLVACYSFEGVLGRWLPLLTVPLVIAALGVVHWMMDWRKLSTNWVTGFYIGLVFFGQLVYPFLISLGLMDSAVDLRKRLQTIQKD